MPASTVVESEHLSARTRPAGGGSVDAPNGQPRAAGRRPADPPLLTGGSIHLYPRFSRGIDFLTFTAPEVTGRELEGWTEFEEEGTGRADGFRRSERRLTYGGRCWRRLEPVTASRAYGLAYESWEWDGAPADLAAKFLRGREGKPSHLDVAFDFEVPDELTADVVAASIAEHVKRQGLKPGINGEGEDRTHYVGARTSERRLRIYRKDLQKGDLWRAMNLPPVLRVELIAKKRVSHALWQKWCDCDEAFYVACAGEVERLSGLLVQAEFEHLPVLSMPDELEPAAQFAQFIEQYAGQLTLWDEAGIDVMAFAREHASWRHDASRLVRSRQRRRASSFRSFDLAYFAELVRSLLRPQSVGAR